ncbi:hypothetical protein AB0K60_29530 [Thermopolyspora sp. NPDC052614]|uniref:hypothetical protein n=1 Tax=Thermopolyspora sp. NPDC052614 TaxID=3155682 RepID=UPI003418631C
MIGTRTLTGLVLVAGALALSPLATAHAATAHAATGNAAHADTAAVTAETSAAKNWGVYYAPGRKAKAYGTIWAAPKNDPSEPTSLVKVRGKVVDRTLKGNGCGWAVFRVSYGDGKGGVPNTLRTFTTCKYGKAKDIAFDFKNVYQVELKVCSEPKAAKPSLNCLYAGSWKSLYVYFK